MIASDASGEIFHGDLTALPFGTFTTGHWTTSLLDDEKAFHLQINSLTGDNLGSLNIFGGEDAAKVTSISKFYYIADGNRLMGVIKFKKGGDARTTLAVVNNEEKAPLYLIGYFENKADILNFPYYFKGGLEYPSSLAGVYSAANSSTGEHGSVLLKTNLGGEYAYVQIYDSEDSLLYEITGSFKYDASKGTGTISDGTSGGALATVKAIRGTDKIFALTVSKSVAGGTEESKFTCVAQIEEVFNGGNAGKWEGDYIIPGSPAGTAILNITNVKSLSNCGTLSVTVNGSQTDFTITGISSFVVGDNDNSKLGVFRGIATIPGSSDKGFSSVRANGDYSQLSIKYGSGTLKLHKN